LWISFLTNCKRRREISICGLNVYYKQIKCRMKEKPREKDGRNEKSVRKIQMSKR
jgi:hypothetical protein